MFGKLVIAAFLLAGLALLVLGPVSYLYGLPAGSIWITGEETQPRLQVALINGVLHGVYSTPKPSGANDFDWKLAGFYLKQVKYGGTEAIGGGVPFWFLAGCALLTGFVGYARGPLRVKRRRRRGQCVHCGYSLAGLPEPRCPECGQAFNSTERLRPR
jgi:hypothetical protein